MPKDKPNEEEIRKIMEKAKKAASSKQKPELVQKEVKKPVEQKQKLEEKPKPEKIIAKEEKKPEPTKPTSEIAELKTLIIQQNQTIGQQNERIAGIENFLKEAQRQAKAQMAQQTGQSNPDQIVDQPLNDENLTDEEKLTRAQAEQGKQDQGSSDQPQMPANVSPGLAYLYAFNPVFKEVAATVRTAMAAKAGKGGGEGDKITLDSLGRDLIVTMIKRQLTGGEGGDNTMEQIKTFSNMQNILMGGFFNTLKYLGKEGAQRIMGNIFEETTSPGSTSPTLPSSEGHIT